jgi:hypothetical protein
LCFLDLGLVLVIERANVVLGLAQGVFGFYRLVDTMGWLGSGIELGVLFSGIRFELPRNSFPLSY